MYRIYVCVKQVPDTTEVRIDPVTNTLVRAGVPSILNPFDRCALETALDIKDHYGAHITVISMGPPQAGDALRECLTLGADDAVLISDRAFGGSDTLATSYTLAAAVRALGMPDMIFCGKQAIDGDTAQVGPELAEHLGLPQITFANSVRPDGQAVRACRELEGESESILCPLPAVITIVKSQGEPYYGTIAGRLAANAADIRVITAEQLNTDKDRLGLSGSPTKVKRIFSPAKEKAGVCVEAPEAVETLMNVLFRANVI